jgi:hypothetical protein
MQKEKNTQLLLVRMYISLTTVGISMESPQKP